MPSTATPPRSLKWLWTPAAKNANLTATIISNGGGILYGIIANNLVASPFNIGIFAFDTFTDTPIINKQVLAFPIGSNGSLIILPEEHGLCEVQGKHMYVYVYAGGDTSFLGAGAGVNSVSFQFATS